MTNEEPRSVMTMEMADRMLAEVASIDDAQRLINFAEMARVYARQSKLGTSAINHATIIKVRAEARLANIVDEGQERGEIAEAGRPENVRAPDISSLDDLGIERQRLAEARLLRDTYSDDDLIRREDEATARDEVLSRHQLLSEARSQNTQNAAVQRERVSVLFPVFEALEALSAIDITPGEWAQHVPEYSAHRITEHLDAAAVWLNGLKEVWNVSANNA
jgi:hypothetical protein